MWVWRGIWRAFENFLTIQHFVQMDLRFTPHLWFGGPVYMNFGRLAGNFTFCRQVLETQLLAYFWQYVHICTCHLLSGADDVTFNVWGSVCSSFSFLLACLFFLLFVAIVLSSDFSGFLMMIDKCDKWIVLFLECHGCAFSWEYKLCYRYVHKGWCKLLSLPLSFLRHLLRITIWLMIFFPVLLYLQTFFPWFSTHYPINSPLTHINYGIYNCKICASHKHFFSS